MVVESAGRGARLHEHRDRVSCALTAIHRRRPIRHRNGWLVPTRNGRPNSSDLQTASDRSTVRFMDDQIRRSLSRGHRIDITTTGRRTGKPRRIEIVFHNIDGRLYISGSPATASVPGSQPRGRPASHGPSQGRTRRPTCRPRRASSTTDPAPCHRPMGRDQRLAELERRHDGRLVAHDRGHDPGPRRLRHRIGVDGESGTGTRRT